MNRAAVQPAGLFWGLTTAHSGPERLIYERWQDWIKNSPELLGSTDYRNEPLIAGQTQAVRVRYRTGIDLGVGSKITVLAPWYSGISFQTQDEARANYLSIRVDLTDASVVTVQVPAVAALLATGQGHCRWRLEGGRRNHSNKSRDRI